MRARTTGLDYPHSFRTFPGDGDFFKIFFFVLNAFNETLFCARLRLWLVSYETLNPGERGKSHFGEFLTELLTQEPKRVFMSVVRLLYLIINHVRILIDYHDI